MVGECIIKVAGKRMTKQKKVILEILQSTKSHPTADWIYEQAKKEIPDISLGTIYRNLKQLKDMGQIMELNYGSSYSRYDGVAENHYHFVCNICGCIYDLDLTIEIPQERVEKLIKGKVTHHRLEFYGICADCK